MTGHRGYRGLFCAAALAFCSVAACDATSNSKPDPFTGDAGTAIPVATEAELAAGTPRLKLTLVDVGQGDGMILELPSGAVVAVDGGPDRTGSYQDAITAMSRVDYIILSHAHSDHYTGLGNAISMLPNDCEGRIYDPGLERPGIGGYEYFRSASGCRYRTAGLGMSLDFDPQVAISVLGVADQPYPTDDGWGINNTSVVTYVRYGSFAAVLTGDAQTDAEQRVVNAHMNLRANVVKVGHHGSCNASATTFLRTVNPQIALVSAGQANDFGHPHCQTLRKLAGQKVDWYRTDRNGSVTVISDGQRYTVVASRGQKSDPVCPRDCASPSDF